jgi:plastocyanin
MEAETRLGRRRGLDDLERKIIRIQKSTRTLIPGFSPIHNNLRARFKWYYFWHILPQSQFVHWAVLGLVVAIATTTIAAVLIGGQPEKIKVEAAEETNKLVPGDPPPGSGNGDYPDTPSQQWTPTPGPTHYTAIDEGSTPDLGDFITASPVVDGTWEDEFNMTTQTITGIKVSKITVWYDCGSFGSNPPSLSSRIYFGSYQSSQSVGCGGDPNWVSKEWNVTGWQTELDGLRVEVTSTLSAPPGGGSRKIVSLYAKATYTVISPPTVTTTDPPPVIGSTTATLGGNITATGGENADTRGFTWWQKATCGGLGSSGWTEGTPGSYVYGTGPPPFTHDITGLLPSTQYSYFAHAHNSGGTGSGSCVTFTTVSSVPSDPSNAYIDPGSSGVDTAKLTVKWTDNATNETGYHLEWQANCTGSWTTIALGAGTNSYAHTGRTANTSYCYRAHAYNGAGDSGYSNTARGQTWASRLEPSTTLNNGITFRLRGTNAGGNDTYDILADKVGAGGSPTGTFTRNNANATYVSDDGTLQTVANANDARLERATAVATDNPRAPGGGVRIEEERTNLLLYSSFEAGTSPPTGWSHGYGLTATVTADGLHSSNYARLVTDGSASTSYLRQAINLTAGTTYTLTTYAKWVSGTNGRFALGIYNASDQYWSSLTTISSTDWQKVTLTATPTLTASYYIYIQPSRGAANVVTCMVDAIQLEAASFATSYIPTTTGTATRNAEALSYSPTNNINKDEGTISYWYKPNATTDKIANGGYPVIGFIALIDGNNYYAIDIYPTGPVYFQAVRGGAGNAIFSPTALDTNWHHLLATWSVSAGKIHFYIDGVESGTGNAFSGLIGTSFTNFGLTYGGTSPDGLISDWTIFNTALNAETVQGLYNGYGPSNVHITEPPTVDQTLTVTFQDNSSNEDSGFDVQYQETGFSWTTSGTEPKDDNPPSHTKGGLNINKEYTFRIRACIEANCASGYYSEWQQSQSPFGTSPPQAVYTLARIPNAPAVYANPADNPKTKLNVTVSANSNPNATNYRVTRDTTPTGAFGTTVENWTAHNDADIIGSTSLTENTMYCYKIRARNGDTPAVETNDSLRCASTRSTHLEPKSDAPNNLQSYIDGGIRLRMNASDARGDESSGQTGTLTRNDTNATFTGDDGNLYTVPNANEPRVEKVTDKEGSTSIMPGRAVRIEETRTNLVYRSSFDSSDYWCTGTGCGGSGATWTPNSTDQAIHGGTSMKVVGSAAGAWNQQYLASGLPAQGVNYTLSFYINVTSISGGYVSVVFNAGGSSNFETAHVSALTNGWKRYTVTGLAGSANSSYQVILNAAGSFTGTAYFDAIQLEQGSFATSYIPTTNGTATRGAETLSYPTASNISATQGTLSFWFKPENATYDAGDTTKFLFQDSANHTIFYNPANAKISINWAYNAGQYATTSGLSTNWIHIVQVWRSNNTLETYINGQSVGTGTHNGTAFGASFFVGSHSSLGRPLNALISDVTVFNTALDADTVRGVYNGYGPSKVSITNPGQTDIDRLTTTWQDNASNETDFDVDYKATGTCTDASGWSSAPGQVPNTTSYQRTGLSTNTQYCFRLRASISSLDSPWQGASAAKYTMIETPTGITATAASTSQIDMSVTNSLTNLTAGSSGIQFDETSGNSGGGGQTGFDDAAPPNNWTNVNSVSDTGLATNTQYIYNVRTRNGDGGTTGWFSSQSRYTKAADPATPTVAAQSWANVTDGNPMRVTINTSNPNGTNFYLESKEVDNSADCANGSGYSQAQNWTAHNNGDNVTQNNLLPDKIICYRIKARNGDTPAVETSYAYGNDRAAPAQPTITGRNHDPSHIVDGHIGNTISSIDWAWNDPTTGVNPDGFKVYVDDGTAYPGSCTSNLKATASNGTDRDVNETSLASANTSYRRCIKPYRGSVYGRPTSGFSAYTSANDPVTGATAHNGVAGHSANTLTGITWTWASGGAQKDYYASDSTGNSGYISGTSWNASSGHTANTQYTVTVKARNGDNDETGNNTHLAYTSANDPVTGATAHNGIAGHSANTTTGITWTWATGGAQKDYYASDTTGNSDWTGSTSWNASTDHETNHQYTASVKARNGDNDETGTNTHSAYTSIEPVSGVNFGTITTSSIASTPANTPSHLDAGNSGIQYHNVDVGIYYPASDPWQQNPNSWTSNTLDVDSQYTITIQSRNGDKDTTTVASDQKYTYANAPGVPTLTAITPHKVNLIVDNNGNPQGDTPENGVQNDTQFRIYNLNYNAGEYLQTDGTYNPTVDWDTYANWGLVDGITNVNDDLTPGVNYTFRVYGRNGDGVITDYGEASIATSGASKLLVRVLPEQDFVPGPAGGIIGPTNPRDAGASFNFIVYAVDTNNWLDASKTGTVSISSSDGQADLPNDADLVAGVKQFSITLKTADWQSVVAHYTGLTNGSQLVKVLVGSPSDLTSYILVDPPTLAINQSSKITVGIRDAYNNALSGYKISISTSNNDDVTYEGNNQITNSSGEVIAYTTSSTPHTSSVTAVNNTFGDHTLPQHPTITWTTGDLGLGARISGPDKAVIATQVRFSGRNSYGDINNYLWQFSDVYYDINSPQFTAGKSAAITSKYQNGQTVTVKGIDIVQAANIKSQTARELGIPETTVSATTNTMQLQKEAQALAVSQKSAVVRAVDFVVGKVANMVKGISAWFGEILTTNNLQSSRLITQVFAQATAGPEIDKVFSPTGYYDISLQVTDTRGRTDTAVKQILIVPPAPVITNVERKGDQIVLTGTAWPDINVELFFSPSLESGASGRTRSSLAGLWTYSVPADEFKVGEYLVYGIAVDDHDITSDPSNEVKFRINIDGDVVIIGELPEESWLAKVMKIIRKLAVALSVVALAGSFASLILGLNFFNILPYLYYIFTMIMEKLGIIKRREPWGIVYDSVTKAPVELAIVRIFDVKRKKLLETRVTGKDGKFGFLVAPGAYKISITKYGYRFVSQVVKKGAKSDDIYSNIYHGAAFAITPEKRLVNYNVPIDPISHKEEEKQSLLQRILTALIISRVYIKRFIIPLLVFAIVLAFTSYIVVGERVDLLISVIMILLLAWEIYDRRQNRNWGVVYDSESKEPIPGTLVKIFDEEYHKLKESRATDQQGRFGFIVPPGRYSVEVEKPDFRFPSTRVRRKNDGKYHFLYHGEIIRKKPKDAVISMDIPLDPE